MVPVFNFGYDVYRVSLTSFRSMESNQRIVTLWTLWNLIYTSEEYETRLKILS